MKENKREDHIIRNTNSPAEDKAAYQNALYRLRETAENLTNDTLRFIGILLEIKTYGWHRIDGYKTIEELAEMEFGFSRTTTYQYLKIGTRFMEKKNDGFMLKPAFQNYGISQLMELCPCEEKDILERFSPDMTIREIRDLKKSLKSPKNPKASEKSVPLAEVRQTVCELELNGLEDYQTREEDILVNIYQAISKHSDHRLRILIDYPVT